MKKFYFLILLVSLILGSCSQNAVPELDNLECYDIATRRMVRAAQGIEDLRIYVGASSADIRLTRE
ncbi:MAG: hypothetical protein IIV72_04865 [Alistipes sp.]|jgi:hypothetical protein|nr:hypothetical protein [Alistipes sp.]